MLAPEFVVDYISFRRFVLRAIVRPYSAPHRLKSAQCRECTSLSICSSAGVMTSDPRMVVHAVPIPLLTFEEATELAFFGAAVLHPLAMQPALQNGNLNVRVKNSYNRWVMRQHLKI